MAGRILGFLAMTALLAPSVSEAQAPSVIVGKVRDRVSHKPLADCFVRITRPQLVNGALVLRPVSYGSTATDSNGVFVFHEPSAGSYWLEIGDAAHLPAYERIASSRTKDTLSIVLERDGSSLPVPLRAQSPQLSPPPPALPESPPPARKTAGAILFRVTDLKGKPIRGANVCFNQVGRNVGVTDSLGRYECRGMWAEQKDILVQADGYMDYRSSFDLHEGDSKTIRVRLTPGHVQRDPGCALKAVYH